MRPFDYPFFREIVESLEVAKFEANPVPSICKVEVDYLTLGLRGIAKANINQDDPNMNSFFYMEFFSALFYENSVDNMEEYDKNFRKLLGQYVALCQTHPALKGMGMC